MTFVSKRAGWSFACVLALAVSSLGCGGESPTSKLASLNESNLQRVANLYFAFQKKHEFSGPPNEEVFKEFVRRYNPEKLKRIGVDPAAIDELFISERDGQPFRIRYGVRGSMMGSQEPVVFEAEGDGGKRLVGFLNLSKREVDEAEYESLWANGAAGAASGAGVERS